MAEYSKAQREKVQKPYITIDNLPDTGEDSVDIGEEYLKGKKALVDAYKKMGEESIGLVVDETAGLGLIKKTGVFDLPGEDNSEDGDGEHILKDELKGALSSGAEAGGLESIDIGKELEANDLPADIITQDITKIVINAASQSGSIGSSRKDIIDAAIEVMEEMDDREDTEVIEDDSSKTLEKIKEKLYEKNILADEDTINIRKEYNLSVLEKTQLEKEAALYEYYKDSENIIISDEEYNKIQQRLEYLEGKIAGLETTLHDHEEADIEGTEEPGGEAPEETVITLEGKITEPGSPESLDMSITIDLEAGTVAGIIYIRVDKEDIKFDMDVPLTGSIDKETREIVMTANDLTLTGTLSADGKSAGGTGSDGIVWNAVRTD